ncbi:TetR/AcrR family transcriptional regulator [Crassaminicella profunda]|uniref:TetR/AcrR family transcriptional regulator n=1 Tax=Crassaminicella profunda TaxID=1286698 RepID=UPI001CA7B632|nr:TetR/AcrR family transcriptional regulator [Crassaminicella profunda]QZY53872.1 TetR/AcrR family transcriptional regulator [Crassaminicella profunda]
MNNLSRRQKEKKERELAMIDAAEKIFINKGFDNVSMNEIAKEAEFTKRTLYKYFESKEELYFAVAIKGFHKMFSYYMDAEEGQNGFDKLKLVSKAYYHFFKECPETVRIINHVRQINKKEVLGPKHRQWREIDEQIFKKLAFVFEEGIADGSIRSDIEPLKGAYTFIFILNGFLHMISESDDSFLEHFSSDVEDFTGLGLKLVSGIFKS